MTTFCQIWNIGKILNLEQNSDTYLLINTNDYGLVKRSIREFTYGLDLECLNQPSYSYIKDLTYKTKYESNPYSLIVIHYSLIDLTLECQVYRVFVGQSRLHRTENTSLLHQSITYHFINNFYF